MGNPVGPDWWENVITEAKSIFPGERIMMDFADSYGGEVLPAGCDIYSLEFYNGTGWETSQGELDSHADAKYSGFRSAVFNANGEVRDIMVTGRGWADPGSPLNGNYPTYLVDWVKRQADIIGIAWWQYVHVGESFLGIIDMPAFATTARNEGIAMGYGFTPPQNLLDNSDFELDRIKTSGNIVPNSSFEQAGQHDSSYPAK